MRAQSDSSSEVVIERYVRYMMIPGVQKHPALVSPPRLLFPSNGKLYCQSAPAKTGGTQGALAVHEMFTAYKNNWKNTCLTAKTALCLKKIEGVS